MSKSEWIIENCLQREQPQQLEQFCYLIEERLYKQKQNKVLFIEENGVEIHGLLSHWANNLKRSIVVPYFIEHESTNYQFAIYIVLNKLKNFLGSNAKIQLQKLKQYFQYWLEYFDKEMCNKMESKQIVLIFQGIDKFKDSNGEIRTSYWLPKILPQNLKIITTGNSNSKAADYFGNQAIKLQEPIMLQLNFQFIPDEVMRKQMEQQFKQLDTYQISTQNEDFNINQKLINYFQIILKNYFEFITENIYKNILLVFTYVNKGISTEEMIQICNCSQEQFFEIIEYFRPFLMNKDDVYWIFNLELKNAIIRSIQKNDSLYEIFLSVFDHSQTSIRKLEELIGQYTKTKKYFKLKEVLINIDNFLILWDSTNKFELCHLWESLEQHGYDLVMEYNKAIENYQALFKPTNEQLFQVMLQVSRFLREFCAFENYHTPDYKHPELRGQSIEFEEVGLYGQLKELQMLAKKKNKQINEEYFPSSIVIEQLNLDVKSNQEILINHYEQQFDSNLMNEYIITKQDYLLKRLIYGSRIPQNYYYKRWIWVQFPWLVLTQKDNYSDQINKESKVSIQTKLTIKKNIKLPQLRRLSPLDTFSQKISKTNFYQSSNSLTPRKYSPLTIQYQQKLDRIIYQNCILKKRLKEYQTLKLNTFPEHLKIQTYQTQEENNELNNELKKQQNILLDSQLEMKRFKRIWKLCQLNQDYNEERAIQLASHSKNLDTIIKQQKCRIKQIHNNFIQVKQQLKQLKNIKCIQPIISPSKSRICNITINGFNDPVIIMNESLNFTSTEKEIKPKFIKLQSSKTITINEKQNQDQQYNKLKEIGLDNLYNNPTYSSFCDNITQCNKLELEISNKSIYLTQLKDQLAELQIQFKILKKQKKPVEQKTNLQIDKEHTLRIYNQKAIRYKELLQYKAMIALFNKNMSLILGTKKSDSQTIFSALSQLI